MILKEDMAILIGQDSQGYGVFISIESRKAWRACFDGEHWFALPKPKELPGNLWVDEEGDFPTNVVGRLMCGTRQVDYVHEVVMTLEEACTVANHISHKILTPSLCTILENAYNDKLLYGTKPADKVIIHTYVGRIGDEWTPVREESHTDEDGYTTRRTYYYIKGMWKDQHTDEWFDCSFDREVTVFKYVYK